MRASAANYAVIRPRALRGSTAARFDRNRAACTGTHMQTEASLARRRRHWKTLAHFVSLIFAVRAPHGGIGTVRFLWHGGTATIRSVAVHNSTT